MKSTRAVLKKRYVKCQKQARLGNQNWKLPCTALVKIKASSYVAYAYCEIRKLHSLSISDAHTPLS